jgi:hypothetical protein
VSTPCPTLTTRFPKPKDDCDTPAVTLPFLSHGLAPREVGPLVGVLRLCEGGDSVVYGTVVLDHGNPRHWAIQFDGAVRATPADQVDLLAIDARGLPRPVLIPIRIGAPVVMLADEIHPEAAPVNYPQSGDTVCPDFVARGTHDSTGQNPSGTVTVGGQTFNGVPVSPSPRWSLSFTGVALGSASLSVTIGGDSGSVSGFTVVAC